MVVVSRVHSHVGVKILKRGLVRALPSRTSFVPHQARHGAHTDSLCPSEFDILLLTEFVIVELRCLDAIPTPNALSPTSTVQVDRHRAAEHRRQSNLCTARLSAILTRRQLL